MGVHSLECPCKHFTKIRQREGHSVTMWMTNMQRKPVWLSTCQSHGHLDHYCVELFSTADNSHVLTHWGRDKMDAISQTTLSNAFLWMNENVRISINISLKFVPKGLINNIPALVQIMAWCRPGDKPLSEPLMVGSPTHICVTRPQWVQVKYILVIPKTVLGIYTSVKPGQGVILYVLQKLVEMNLSWVKAMNILRLSKVLVRHFADFSFKCIFLKEKSGICSH